MTKPTSCGQNASTLELRELVSLPSAATGRCRRTVPRDNNVCYWILRLARARWSFALVNSVYLRQSPGAHTHKLESIHGSCTGARGMFY